MNLTSVALFVVALLMMSAGPGTDSAQLLLDGNHRVVRTEGAIVVAEASVEIPAEGQVAGPIYVIGGELDVAGRVDTDIVQLAGTVTIGDGAVVAGELQHIAGTQVIDANASVGRMTAAGMGQASSPGFGRWLSLTMSAVIVAAISAVMVRRRPTALANVTNATSHHPVICLTVGTMVSITFLSLFVFMAFTLVLIPVALLGVLTGLVVMVYGVIGWGHFVGRRLPLASAPAATALGVVVIIVLMQVATLVPVIGDLTVIIALLSGAGAVLVTYFGLTEFQPALSAGRAETVRGSGEIV